MFDNRTRMRGTYLPVPFGGELFSRLPIFFWVITFSRTIIFSAINILPIPIHQISKPKADIAAASVSQNFRFSLGNMAAKISGANRCRAAGWHSYHLDMVKWSKWSCVFKSQNPQTRPCTSGVKPAARLISIYFTQHLKIDDHFDHFGQKLVYKRLLPWSFSRAK